MIVWAIMIACMSLSCERIPAIAGWFDSPEDCISTAEMIVESWKPDVGIYEVRCFQRTVI